MLILGFISDAVAGNLMGLFLVLVPVLSWAVIWLVYVRKATCADILRGLVKAYITIYAFIALSTELLSWFQAIAFAYVLAAWLVLLLAGAGIVFAQIRAGAKSLHWPSLPRPGLLTGLILGAVCLILTATFLSAILYPPNNWDSMTYHMPRVMHWISNGQISFYPTEIPRQNYQMPLAEYAIMHLQILSGGDRYANLVQWAGFVLLICLGVETGRELGLAQKARLLAALAMASIPMAVLQASSTQNDVAVSAFVLCFAYFMLRMQNRLCLENIIFAALSLGFALLTKGTAYVYCAAVGIALSLPLIYQGLKGQRHIGKVLSALLIIVVMGIAINSAHILRIYTLYGKLNVSNFKHFQNKKSDSHTLFSNLIRNASIHFATPSPQANRLLLSLVSGALGSQLNSKDTTWRETKFSIRYGYHEDFSGNPFHVILAGFSLMSLLILWRNDEHGRHGKLVWYAVSIVAALVLFCLLLKWQPWNTRLHTPIFAMLAVLLPLAVLEIKPFVLKGVCLIIFVLMVINGLTAAINNETRSLVQANWLNKSREELYFTNNPKVYHSYKKACDIALAKGAGPIGLYIFDNDYEYPLWAMAGARGQGFAGLSFRHLGVSGKARKLAGDKPLPGCVIATKELERWKYSSDYRLVYEDKIVRVFEKDPASAAN